MTIRVAILCNGLVPGTDVPSGAQGLRAFGLWRGLSRHGIAAEVVARQGMVHWQLEKWRRESMRIPPHCRILADAAVQPALDADYDAVILQNWAAFPDYRKGDGVRLVYDFFSPTLVEHAFLKGAEEVAGLDRRKRAIVAQADLVIANGDGRAAYARDYLARIGAAPREVRSVRLALPWNGREAAPEGGFGVFFGGFDQAWIRGLGPDGLATLARACRCEVHAVGLGQHLHFATPTGARPAGDARVIRHPPMAYEGYAALNAGCQIALDVFEENEERRLSYSTRAVTALANGCPVVTMGFTEIGRLVAETGAGWTLERFSLEDLVALVQRIMDDPDDLREKRRNTRRFWERFCDPAHEARALAEALTEALA